MHSVPVLIHHAHHAVRHQTYGQPSESFPHAAGASLAGACKEAHTGATDDEEAGDSQEDDYDVLSRMSLKVCVLGLTCVQGFYAQATKRMQRAW